MHRAPKTATCAVKNATIHVPLLMPLAGSVAVVRPILHAISQITRRHNKRRLVYTMHCFLDPVFESGRTLARQWSQVAPVPQTTCHTPRTRPLSCALRCMSDTCKKWNVRSSTAPHAGGNAGLSPSSVRCAMLQQELATAGARTTQSTHSRQTYARGTLVAQ